MRRTVSSGVRFNAGGKEDFGELGGPPAPERGVRTSPSPVPSYRMRSSEAIGGGLLITDIENLYKKI